MKITLPDGSEVEAEHGVVAAEILKRKLGDKIHSVLAIKINGKVADVNSPLTDDSKIETLTWNDPEGVEVFWHSTAHLLAHAVEELWPEAKNTIGPVIEEGFYYDFAFRPFTPEDLDKIEAKMKEIAERKIDVERIELSKKEALEKFKDNKYKVEIINQVDEGDTISAYKQGDFIDLCRGPHLPNTKMIKAFKLTKVSSAYWRGDSNNDALSRIYGISFPERKMLKEYLQRLEEAKKRDHRRIGKDQDLFFFSELSPGSAFFQPKGAIVYNELLNFLKDEYFRRGYKEVITPNIFNKRLWETSGHWEHFRENMFLTKVENEDIGLKPMNCPGHLVLFKQTTKSYKDLPLRIAEFGVLHRNELSGTLSGLTRVRRFCQDDAHIFVAPEQIKDEVKNLLDFVKYIYTEVFNFEYRVDLSTRPEKAMGDKALWDSAEKQLSEALEEKGVEYNINEGDGAFYGPKIDIHLKDALGRSWQCATIQLDFNLPERFKAQYEGKDGSKHNVVMIHRAMFGSMERFIGVLTEHFAGKFPIWLSPVQVILLPIADRHVDYAEDYSRMLREEGIRVEVDSRSESINKKVREAQLKQIPYILIVGDAEIENTSVNVRTRDNKVHGEKNQADFRDEVLAAIKTKKIDP